MTRRGDFVERVAGRHVHDVQRHVAGDVAEHDGAMRRFGLERRRSRVAVVLRVGLAAGEGLLHQHVDGDAVLGVHHDDRAALGSRLHGFQDLPVVAVEHAGVGHEQLEAGDALVLGEVLHVLQRLVVDAADDLVKGVVDGAIAVGLAVPVGKAVEHVLAVTLHGHVDDRRDAAPRRGAEPVSNVSLANVPPNGSSMWVCTSTPPGITYLPAASMTRSQPSSVK